MIKKYNVNIRQLVVLILIEVMIAGCIGGNVETKDPFFEKWEALAKESMGHSPSGKKRDFTLPKGVAVDDIMSVIEVLELPTNNITLNLRNADIKSVLLSLSNATDQNMIIKSDIKGLVSVDLEDVPWDQAFRAVLRSQGLTYVWEGDIIQVVTDEDMEQDLKLLSIRERRNAQLLGAKQAEPLLTTMVRIDYADAEKLAVNLAQFLTKDEDGKARGAIVMDKHSNSLIIKSIRDDLIKMISLIEKIDKSTAQIHIKANIVETNKQTAKSLGIQWGGFLRNGDLYITPGGTAGDNFTGDGEDDISPIAGGTGLSGRGFGVNFPITEQFATAGASGTLGLMFGVLNGDILDLQLQALQESGEINILSSPSITTLDNQMAFTETGEKVPYITTKTSGGGDSQQTVEFVDAVLRLEITPHVIDEENMKMHILVRKDEVDFSRSVQGNPLISTKETETNLIVQDGETIVISGLTKQKITDVVKGIPILKDLPAIGRLFRNKAKSDNMEEVLIFITPHILPPRTTAVARNTAGESVIGDERMATIQKGLNELVIREGFDEMAVQKGPNISIVKDGKGISIVRGEKVEGLDLPEWSVPQKPAM